MLMFLAEQEIDWRLLRIAKTIMLRLANENTPHLSLSESERYSCNSIIGLLDYIQDQAEKYVPNTDLFTYKELEKDFKDLINIEFDGDVDNALYHLVDEHGKWLDAFVTRDKADTQRRHIKNETGIGAITILTYPEWMQLSRPNTKIKWPLGNLPPLISDNSVKYEYYCPECNRIWTEDNLPANTTCELHKFTPIIKRPRTLPEKRT